MITKRWIDGPTASDEEWDRIDGILAARGWMSLARATTRIRLAEEDGKVCGFFVFQLTPMAGPMYVAPAHRGTGLADELADEMLEFLTEVNARGWIIVADNPHVPEMCEKRGMQKMKSTVYTTDRS